MPPKVSVIVPVYGVEEYIGRCARSLFEQTIDDLEFIFVDDCTKDNSIKVLQSIICEYPKRKEHTIILHHEINKGLPQARRTGMLSATGEYIINIDSDDWTSISMIELLYRSAKDNNADIVICDYYKTNGQEEKVIKACNTIEKKQFLQDLCCMKHTWSVWNKMIKRELLDEKVVFPMEGMGEDMGLILPMVLKARKLSYVPVPLYYYWHNPNSMTHLASETATLKKYNMFLSNTKIVIDAFINAGLSEEYRCSLDAVKLRAKNQLIGLVHKKDYHNLWKKTYREINFRILFNALLGWKDKVVFLLTFWGLFPSRKGQIKLDM